MGRLNVCDSCGPWVRINRSRPVLSSCHHAVSYQSVAKNLFTAICEGDMGMADVNNYRLRHEESWCSAGRDLPGVAYLRDAYGSRDTRSFCTDLVGLYSPKTMNFAKILRCLSYS